MNGTALPIPADGDQDRGTQFLTIIWSECILASVFVASRFLTRFVYIKKLGWDDWVILLTLVRMLHILTNYCSKLSVTQSLVFIFSTLWTEIVKNGGGRHAYYLSHEQLTNIARLQTISQPITITALALGKVSVALFLLRLIGPSRWKRIALQCIMVGATLAALFAIITVFVRCTPFQRSWKKQLSGHCWRPIVGESLTVFIGGKLIHDVLLKEANPGSAYFCLTDLLLAIFPVSIVQELQISLWRKVTLVFLLGSGVLAAVAAAIKTSKLPLLNDHRDITRSLIPTLVWAATECCVVIVAACVPTIRPLFQDLVRKAGLDSRYGECLCCGGVQGANCRCRKDTNIRGALKTIYSRTSSQTTILFDQPSIRASPIRQESGLSIQTVGSDEQKLELEESRTDHRMKGGDRQNSV